MFESAELGLRVDKAAYDEEVPRLRAELLDLQYELFTSRRFPVLILVNGLDGAGKGETVNLLNAWMDPHHIRTEGFADPSEEERRRPPMWRYWQALPGKGRVGVFFGNWYAEPITGWVRKDLKRGAAAHHLERILRFEKMLADEGALIVKFWFHLSKDAQRQRLKTLAKDPKSAWRITEQDWWRFENYDRYHRMAEYVLRRTSTAYAPWVAVDGFDPRFRALTVGRLLAAAIRKRLAQPDATLRIAAAPLQPVTEGGNVLTALDLEQRLAKKRYVAELDRWQGRLNQLVRDERFAGRSLVLVFEGNDAAGKGGAIQRITGALDARCYRVIPIGAPTEEERDQPYLWRFWRHVPAHGRVAIFDRSWYGRVLVERVEGFCSEADWMRAYSEINDFEDQLVRHGAVVVKFWLSISQEEQLRRFKSREETQFKRFKITEEDWRNREKWGAYETAVCQMVDRTSTEFAPWTLVEAEDKNFARIKVLKTVVKRLEAALDGQDA